MGLWVPPKKGCAPALARGAATNRNSPPHQRAWKRVAALAFRAWAFAKCAALATASPRLWGGGRGSSWRGGGGARRRTRPGSPRWRCSNQGCSMAPARGRTELAETAGGPLGAFTRTRPQSSRAPPLATRRQRESNERGGGTLSLDNVALLRRIRLHPPAPTRGGHLAYSMRCVCVCVCASDGGVATARRQFSSGYTGVGPFGAPHAHASPMRSVRVWSRISLPRGLCADTPVEDKAAACRQRPSRLAKRPCSLWEDGAVQTGILPGAAATPYCNSMPAGAAAAGRGQLARSCRTECQAVGLELELQRRQLDELRREKLMAVAAPDSVFLPMALGAGPKTAGVRCCGVLGCRCRRC